MESLGEWTAEIAAVRKACGAASDAIGGVKNGVSEAEELAKANNFSIADDGSITDQGRRRIHRKPSNQPSRTNALPSSRS